MREAEGKPNLRSRSRISDESGYRQSESDPNIRVASSSRIECADSELIELPDAIAGVLGVRVLSLGDGELW